jgi:hypothetical protein
MFPNRESQKAHRARIYCASTNDDYLGRGTLG